MRQWQIIEKATTEGRKTLTEAEAKEFLKIFGIPVVEEKTAQTVEDAEKAAAKMGYPVVLKGLGANLTHKTEKGLVKLNLTSSKDLQTAAHNIKDRAGIDLEGFLIQPMLEGKREFVAGLFHDEQFGPVIMFGLGGIFTEALADVVFRLAPVDEADAVEMIEELNAQKLLGDFRGEQAPDRQALIRTLTGLSQIALEAEQIREIDINPLLITADGTVTAVDALIVLGTKETKDVKHFPVKPEEIGNLFYPQSIAFIGASGEFGKWGHLLFTSAIGGKYQGEIYLVNAKGEEIAGRKAYKSVTEIPEPVDLAVVTVPAKKVISLIPELKAKNIRSMLLISSGFSEIGQEGKVLEDALVDEARKAGILILGPNTMGMCNPHISLYCVGSHVHPKPGGTVWVAQSGNLGTQLLAFAEKEDIGIRAFSGSGNEAMISVEDYLEGFAVDEKTTTVVLYIESIKNGRRFFEAAKSVGKKKPVIILKGGRSEVGAKAAASHTGAMASNVKVFDAACRQAGVVLVENTMDLLDLSAVFSSLPLPRGNRVGIMTFGGGWGVVAADLCAKYGLKVPTLPDKIISNISEVLPAYWSHANPVDIVGEFEPNMTKKIVEDLLAWDECDAVIHMGILGKKVMLSSTLDSAIVADKNYNSGFKDAILQILAEFERQFTENNVNLMEKYQKPVIGVYLLSDDTTHTITDVNADKYKSVSFITPERAVKSLAQMYRYAKWLNK